MTSLEEAWEYREEVAYPRLFGTLSRGIFPLSPSVFIPDARIDPSWLSYGVFEYAPNEERQSYLYVTSGPSNPFDDGQASGDEDSGVGLEFALETAEQADWAILLLQNMLAYDLLLGSGQVGSRPFGLGDRIPLRDGVDGSGGDVRFVIVGEPVSFEKTFRLPSGKVDIWQFYGATEAERDIARDQGFEALRAHLIACDSFPAINPKRP